MLWLFYNILFVIGFLVLIPRFLYRMCRRGGYAKDFMQRIGLYRADLRKRLASGRWVWIQAVSVGEVFVAFRFMEEMRQRKPGMRFVLSTNTSTGHAIAKKKIGDDDILIYFPLDFPLVMKRVLRLIRPMALVLVECELWPNLIRYTKKRNVPVLLINGRISDHSYQGYRKLRLFTRQLLPMVDLLCVQSEGDVKRLVDLGAPNDRVQVMGSAKYEVAQKDLEGESTAGAILQSIGYLNGTLVLLGGSTWPGEEEILIRIYKKIREKKPEVRLVLAPRHVERTADVLKEIEAAGLGVMRRSQWKESSADAGAPPDVFLIDTTGELKNFYAHAAVIFIGKSLTEHGGQNVIEPAFYGKPVVVGPNMENFLVVMKDFLEADALVQVRDEVSLENVLETLLSDGWDRIRYGERAARLVSEKTGAMRATVDRLQPFFG